METQCSQVMMLRKNLKSKLDPMRYEHSLSVSFTCMNLAMRYGYDMDKAENLPIIRKMAFEDLDGTMYAILSGTLEYLDKKGGNIDPMTVEAYEYFKRLKGDSNELKGNG